MLLRQTLLFLFLQITCLTVALAQTTLLSDPGLTYGNTDGPTFDNYGVVDISTCVSVVFSIDYSFSDSWEGSGNMETPDECGAFGDCAGDINNPTLDGCSNCWDFLIADFSIDGSAVYSDIIGDIGTTDAEQTGVITYTYCTQAGDGNAEIDISTQTWASAESVNFSNITILCYETATPECSSACFITIDDVFPTDPSCDNTTDGEIEIDASGTGLSGSLEYSINNGSSFQSGNIFTNLGPGTYDIVVQDDLDPSCFATTTITLTGTVIPAPSTPAPLTVCFNLVPLDGELLNLGAIIDEIRNFDPSYTVTFYFDLAATNDIDLTDPADILALLNMMPTTIFATITDGICESMTVAVSVDLNNYPNPPNGMLEECSMGGNATFTLSDADDQFTGGNPDLSVSYHNTLGNAENGASPIFTVTTPSDLTVFVRVENSAGCASTAELDLVVSSGDTPNNASLSACDDGSGQGTFDLTTVDGDVLGAPVVSSIMRIVD
jgi:hypothetical protein